MSCSPQLQDLSELPREAEVCFLESVNARVWCQDEMFLIPMSNDLVLKHQAKKRKPVSATLWGQCDNVKIDSQQMLLSFD